MTTLLLGAILACAQPALPASTEPYAPDAPASPAPAPGQMPPLQNGAGQGSPGGNTVPATNDTLASPAPAAAVAPDAWCPTTPGNGKQDRFGKRLFNAYFGPEEENGNEPEPARRGLPAPFESPPFPSNEYLIVRPIGVPHTDVYPLMKAIYAGPNGDAIKDSRIQVYGWLDVAANWSSSTTNNLPNAFNGTGPADHVIDKFCKL
jgi:hypothetical protein